MRSLANHASVLLATLVVASCGQQSHLPHLSYPSAIAHWSSASVYLIGSYSGRAIHVLDEASRTLHVQTLETGTVRPSHILRIAIDESRRVLWVLSLEHVFAYRLGRLASDPPELLKRIPVPMSRVHPKHCLPDIVLGADGTAYATSTHSPTVVEVKTGTLEATIHTISLPLGKGLPTGFSGIATGPAEPFLLAIDAASGTLWRINITTWEAVEVRTAGGLHGACGILLRGTTRPELILTGGFQGGVRLIVLSQNLLHAITTVERHFPEHYVFSALHDGGCVVWPLPRSGVHENAETLGNDGVDSLFAVVRAPLQRRRPAPYR